VKNEDKLDLCRKYFYGSIMFVLISFFDDIEFMHACICTVVTAATCLFSVHF